MKKVLKYGCLSIVGFFLLVGILGALAGTSDTDDEVVAVQNSGVESNQGDMPENTPIPIAQESNDETSQEQSPEEPTSPPEPTSTPEPTPAPGVGQDVIVGEVRWHIREVDNLGNVLHHENQFIDDLTTQGTFIRVRFDVENLSNDMLSFWGADLVDAQGREFTASSDAFSFIPNNEQSVLVSNLNPNVPETLTIIYEVPADATGLMFRAGSLKLFGNEEILISLGM